VWAKKGVTSSRLRISGSLVVQRGDSETLDPIVESRQGLLTVSFAESSSDAYDLAVNVARGSCRYAEAEIGKQRVHLVAFDKTPDEAARALTLLQYVGGWRTTQVFAAGKLMVNAYGVAEVLECYLGAGACTDRSAHCQTVIDDPYEGKKDREAFRMRLDLDSSSLSQRVEVDRYLFPCAFLKKRFRFQMDHPANLRDQIEAAAIKEGCALLRSSRVSEDRCAEHVGARFQVARPPMRGFQSAACPTIPCLRDRKGLALSIRR